MKKTIGRWWDFPLPLPLTGGVLAITLTSFFQGGNGQLAVTLGEHMIGFYLMMFYGVGIIATLIPPKILQKGIPPIIILGGSSLLMMGSAATLMAAQSPVVYILCYIGFSFSHYTAYTTVAVLFRLSLPKERSTERRGGSVWSTLCYLCSTATQVVFAWGGQSNWVWWTLLSVFTSLLIFYVASRNNRDALKGRVEQPPPLFDWGAIFPCLPHAVIIASSSMLLALMQFYLPEKGYVVLAVHQMVCALGGYPATSIAEKRGDWAVTMLGLALSLIGLSAIVTGAFFFCVVGGAAIGLAVGFGRTCFSQMASTHATAWGRGVTAYNALAVRMGSVISSVIALTLTFKIMEIRHLWWIAMIIIAISMIYMIQIRRKLN